MKTVLFCVLVLFGLQVAPEFEVRIPPGEGIPHLFARVPALELREAPAAHASVVANLEWVSGVEVGYDSTKVLTLVSGVIVATDNARVDGSNWGRATVVTREEYYRAWHQHLSEPVQPGDTIRFLQYRAEADCFVRIGEMVISASPCPTFQDAQFEVLAEPEVEWWVHVVHEGVPRGWLLITDSVVAVRRSF